MDTISVEKLPRKVLETAIQLRNSHRNIFLTLHELGKPSMANEVAKKLGFQRAYVHMRLLELVDRGLVKKIHEGRKVKFEVML